MTSPLSPAELTPIGAEFGRVEIEPDAFSVFAGPATDAFSPPDGGAPVDRLPGLRLPLGPGRLAGPLTVAARVAPDLAAAFDAGALVLRSRTGAWAKLAYELSPGGTAMAVSVVTRGTSDDSNGPSFALPALWLRVHCAGPVTAFHISQDGARWDLLRLFALPGTPSALDFVAQSPTGQGCRARFDRITRSAAPIPDLRDGT